MSRNPGVRYFLATSQEYFNKLRDAVDPSRTDLTSWADLQDLEEGRTVSKR